MSTVLIGIYAHSEPGRLRATLGSLRAHTKLPYDLLILLDGAEVETRNAAESFAEIPKSSTEVPLGMAACFNRLARWNNADRIVFLESGIQVTPFWLEKLLAALDADNRNGLAGPSTNLSWNEQRVRSPAEANAGWRTLEPLHSLGDFCYAVRRDVIDALGAADEGYGLGPCWEMDYNIRASRAGFAGVWVCDAYVQRQPFTRFRSKWEAELFPASRRRYQDKFCALRLRNERQEYEPHCRGETCEHFAPKQLIKIREPFALAPRNTLDKPLITCIMPTRDRRSFVQLAITYFLRQDYEPRELIIVDDGRDRVEDCVPPDPRIRYLHIPGKMSIGAKRNLACSEANGDFIAHWDDDDWYSPSRLSRQAAILAGADICGSSQLYYFNPAHQKAWRYKFGARSQRWVAGNTLAYRKAFWRACPFPEIDVGEDTRFLQKASVARIVDLNDLGLCVGLIHPSNTSPKPTGGSWWRHEPVSSVASILISDMRHYARHGSATLPLISCIMPTRDRRAFVRIAVDAFLAQDYPNKELIVVDDGDDPIQNLLPDKSNLRYLRLTERASIGRKRNLGCQHASGELIAHFDDDDWYAPGRLSYQADPILHGTADIAGLENAFTLDLSTKQFWAVSSTLHKRMFVGDVHGGTLMFRRSILNSGLYYPDTSLAEDAWLLRRAMSRGRKLARLPNPGVFVYMRHGRNAWAFEPGRFIEPNGWLAAACPPGLSTSTIERYRIAAGYETHRHESEFLGEALASSVEQNST